MGSKGQNSTFSEHELVAFQIKENHECNNMVANVLPAVPRPDPGVGVKRLKFNFQKMVMLHIELKKSQIQQHVCKYFARRSPSTLGMGSVGQTSTFSEHGHVAYQIKGNHEFNNMVANILHAYPMTLGDGIKI